MCSARRCQGQPLKTRSSWRINRYVFDSCRTQCSQSQRSTTRRGDNFALTSGYYGIRLMRRVGATQNISFLWFAKSDVVCYLHTATHHAYVRTLQLALKYHPDRTRNDPAASELFKNISAAYAVILDPNSRRQHDLALASSGSGSGNPLSESIGTCISRTSEQVAQSRL
jgi:DnaJ domain